MGIKSINLFGRCERIEDLPTRQQLAGGQK